MQLNYLGPEGANNLLQPEKLISESNTLRLQKPPKKHVETVSVSASSSSSDGEHYDFNKRDSESCDSHPTTPSETRSSSSSDEDIQTILDNVLLNNNSNPKAMNNIISKCDDSAMSPLARRRHQLPMYIICPTPSGWKGKIYLLQIFSFFYYEIPYFLPDEEVFAMKVPSLRRKSFLIFLQKTKSTPRGSFRDAEAWLANLN